MPGRFMLDGNARMRQRPMTELIDALRQQGAAIDGNALPLTIAGASLRGGRCVLRRNFSSQFVSALLLIAPARGADIVVEGELASKPYVDMTLEVMRAFGVTGDAVARDGTRRFRVKPSSYQPTHYACPPDATAAGYFWGAAAVTGSRCVIDGLTRQDAQPDARLVEVFERMGCRVLESANGLGIDASRVEPRALEADMSDMPDSAQTLAVVCAFAGGTSRLTGLSTLRVKETDRIAALQSELGKLGVRTRAGDDWLEIDGPCPAPGSSAPEIETFDDHRMAMSFAIAGLRVPLKIKNPDCVSKSFPDFWSHWSRLAQG
jgi:3-phosphoshikimate 1-carboxyvinyltransferase